MYKCKQVKQKSKKRLMNTFAAILLKQDFYYETLTFRRPFCFCLTVAQFTVGLSCWSSQYITVTVLQLK